MASIIIFGGAGAIDGAIARRVMARGGRPHLVGRSSAKIEALAHEIGAPASTADVTDPAAIEAAVGEAAADGGLAGLVVASHLSDNSNTTVLVIEAGPSGDAVKDQIGELEFWFPSLAFSQTVPVLTPRVDRYPGGNVLPIALGS